MLTFTPDFPQDTVICRPGNVFNERVRIGELGIGKVRPVQNGLTAKVKVFDMDAEIIERFGKQVNKAARDKFQRAFTTDRKRKVDNVGSGDIATAPSYIAPKFRRQATTVIPREHQVVEDSQPTLASLFDN